MVRRADRGADIYPDRKIDQRPGEISPAIVGQALPDSGDYANL